VESFHWWFIPVIMSMRIIFLIEIIPCMIEGNASIISTGKEWPREALEETEISENLGKSLKTCDASFFSWALTVTKALLANEQISAELMSGNWKDSHGHIRGISCESPPPSCLSPLPNSLTHDTRQDIDSFEYTVQLTHLALIAVGSWKMKSKSVHNFQLQFSWTAAQLISQRQYMLTMSDIT